MAKEKLNVTCQWYFLKTYLKTAFIKNLGFFFNFIVSYTIALFFYDGIYFIKRPPLLCI